jgi:hypothetical protein
VSLGNDKLTIDWKFLINKWAIDNVDADMTKNLWKTFNYYNEDVNSLCALFINTIIFYSRYSAIQNFFVWKYHKITKINMNLTRALKTECK